SATRCLLSRLIWERSWRGTEGIVRRGVLCGSQLERRTLNLRAGPACGGQAGPLQCQDSRGTGCPIYLGRVRLVPEGSGTLVPVPPGVPSPLRRLGSVPGSVLGASPCCL